MPAEPRSLVGQVAVDAQGRSLRVDRVSQDDPLGREIVGVLFDGGRELGGYACTAQTFREVWIERTPARTLEEQERVRKNLKV